MKKYQYEVHTINTIGEDYGVMIFENGELAIYPTAKLAQTVADGMNLICETKCKEMICNKYVVIEKEA